jgi:hypothetical protein
MNRTVVVALSGGLLCLWGAVEGLPEAATVGQVNCGVGTFRGLGAGRGGRRHRRWLGRRAEARVVAPVLEQVVCGSHHLPLGRHLDFATVPHPRPAELFDLS